jgi:hypothetical protein
MLALQKKRPFAVLEWRPGSDALLKSFALSHIGQSGADADQPARRQGRGRGRYGRLAVGSGQRHRRDALSVLGIKHIDTPCTPFKVWQAIHGAMRHRADTSKIG